jgi:hypothetical protein
MNCNAETLSVIPAKSMFACFVVQPLGLQEIIVNYICGMNEGR